MGVLIDTSLLPAPERFGSWRDWWARPQDWGVPPIEVSATAQASFVGMVALFRLGAVTVMHIRSEASETTFPRASIADVVEPAVLLNVQHRGHGTFLFPHGVSRTAPGVVTLTHESEPFTLSTETPTELTVLKAQPRDLGPRFELRASSAVSEGGGFGTALEPFVASVVAGLLAGTIREDDPGLGDCLLGAMRVVLGGVTATDGSALLARIKTDIDANLADPGLTPRAIADRHYISIRQLHKLFEDEPLTVSRWIRHRRLDRCRAELADPAHADVPVQAIAARWGLSSPSHFAHAFRLAYGCSPQAYRRGARG